MPKNALYCREKIAKEAQYKQTPVFNSQSPHLYMTVSVISSILDNNNPSIQHPQACSWRTQNRRTNQQVQRQTALLNSELGTCERTFTRRSVQDWLTSTLSLPICAATFYSHFHMPRKNNRQYKKKTGLPDNRWVRIYFVYVHKSMTCALIAMLAATCHCQKSTPSPGCMTSNIAQCRRTGLR